MRDLSGVTFPRVIRYATAVAPAVALLAIGALINSNLDATNRAERVADHARLAAASVDLKLRQLLEITSFCATAPALTERVDLISVAENCGRYASRVAAWVVIVEIGETHRQILNTRPDAPATLPTYPQEEEEPTLRALEEQSRASGTPGIAEVFKGIVYPSGVISAGQYLHLADGRPAMLYVGISAETLSEQLAGFTVDGGSLFSLVDPSGRIVARSIGIDQMMFADAPGWFLPHLQTGVAGAALDVPGPEVIGGTWDAGYYPLSTAPGWMAIAVQPASASSQSWAPVSLPSAISLFGLLLSGLILWVMADRNKAAHRLAEAEQRSQEKSRILASLAHDIRSPLISLIGSLELIEQGSETGNGKIRSAHGSAEALLQLVDDILELSFLSSGQMKLHPSPIDLRQVAEALADQIRPLAALKGLELHLDLDPDMPVTVEVDRLRLQQILSNLLTNAVKYTEEGSVTLRVCQKGVRMGNVTLELAVIDTGIGVAPADIPRILREFGRLDREAEQREQGVGLGLAIVQRLLSRMGSKLTVESAPGQGSTFSFRLTLPVRAGEEIADAARPLADVFVLYVEDERVIRQLTVRRLEEAGARVICAEDGEDALRHLGTVTPDLVLTDLQMPRLDGAGLINRLNEIAPERCYPIFVLTSHISGPQAAEARAAGADAVFTKPVQVATLAASYQARHGALGSSAQLPKETAQETVAPFLDPDTFHEATGTMGPDRAASIVADFEVTMRRDLSELEAAIRTVDLRQVVGLAHRCQGLCLVIGATTLARELRKIELAAAKGDMAILQDMAAGMAACLDATMGEMRSALHNNSVKS